MVALLVVWACLAPMAYRCSCLPISIAKLTAVPPTRNCVCKSRSRACVLVRWALLPLSVALLLSHISPCLIAQTPCESRAFGPKRLTNFRSISYQYQSIWPATGAWPHLPFVLMQKSPSLCFCANGVLGCMYGLESNTKNRDLLRAKGSRPMTVHTPQY